MGITRPRPDGGVKPRKAPGALDPAVFPLPLRVQSTLRSLKIRAQVCKFMKLVIYGTFDVFAATPPPRPPHVFSAPFSLC